MPGALKYLILAEAKAVGYYSLTAFFVFIAGLKWPDPFLGWWVGIDIKISQPFPFGVSPVSESDRGILGTF